jgi:hypothetical protein
MPTVQEAERPSVLDRAATDTTVAAIFLHAGWRSCGTWLWETLRESSQVRAYYEPLHEELARLDRTALGHFSPASWASGHSPGAPYFSEYASRLNPDGRGMRGYAPRFAFDNFFADPADDDAPLENYLRGLTAGARAEGRLPVLKFCRSLGRVPWMARRFPDAFHAVVLRDPVAQWQSARRQMELAKNRYFVLAPFMILARNAHHPLLADAIARLDVPMPPHLSNDLSVTTQVCWHHVQRLNWAERYRGFLALWVASSLTALRANVSVIDADLLSTDTIHRTTVERALSSAANLQLTLIPGRALEDDARWIGSPAEAQDAIRSAFAALDFVAAWRGAVRAPHAALLARKLTPRFTGARGRPLTREYLPLPSPRRRMLPEIVRQFEAATYVAAARLTYPLRRAHFHFRRWMPLESNK